MRLCHIVPSLEERHGGPSKSVRSLCRALARAGHEVDLLTTDPRAPATGVEHVDGKLRVRSFRREWPQFLRPSGALRRALDATHPDVVQHHALWLRTLHYAHLSAETNNVPLVISPRGMMSAWAINHHKRRKQVARALVHPGAFETAAGWHATSEDERADILRVMPATKVCVAHNGVDEPSGRAIEEARAYWLAACPEAASQHVALFYGRFHQKKRVLELIDLWLERSHRDWLLLMVGLPEQYTPASLEQYVRRYSGMRRVRVMDGTGLPAPYAISSLFLLPSHTENFGLTVAESLAHGVPAIVTDTTPWRGLNTEGRGWCVPWAEFGSAMESAFAEGAQALSSRGARARSWVLRDYSWDSAARQLIEFYRQLQQKH